MKSFKSEVFEEHWAEVWAYLWDEIPSEVWGEVKLKVFREVANSPGNQIRNVLWLHIKESYES